ncbi:MAG TPA: DsrE family protein [Cellvibrionaceae bacterium]
MHHYPFKLLIALTLLLTISLAARANEPDESTIEEVLIMLTDDSLQTQGMALVLGNTMADQGAKVYLLLCDSAGHLAVKKYQSAALKPKNITPSQMLHNLMNKGADVKVCALYLPNSGHTPADLVEGITPASPADIARQMLKPSFRVFTF